MSIINYYNSPTVINWNLDDDGKKISTPISNESKQVVDGKIPLEGLPDEQYRIKITGYVEIDIKDKIDSTDKFKCDYTHGVLYFDQSIEGEAVNIDKYYSRGQFFIPASRVWSKLSVEGKVIQTIGGAFEQMDSQLSDINKLKNTRIHEGSNSPADTRFWYDTQST